MMALFRFFKSNFVTHILYTNNIDGELLELLAVTGI